MTFYALRRWVNDLLRKKFYHPQMRLVEYFRFHPGFTPLSPIAWEMTITDGLASTDSSQTFKLLLVYMNV